MAFCLAIVSTCLGAMWQLADRMEKQTTMILKDVQDARAVADSAARAKSEFLGNVSHYIRTPLNGMIGWCFRLCWRFTFR